MVMLYEAYVHMFLYKYTNTHITCVTKLVGLEDWIIPTSGMKFSQAETHHCLPPGSNWAQGSWSKLDCHNGLDVCLLYSYLFW